MDVDLLERDTELAVIEDLIGAAAGGGRLLAIEGPPGIGKTSLMAETRARGEEAGMQVFGARGSELERRFSYGVDSTTVVRVVTFADVRFSCSTRSRSVGLATRTSSR